MIRASKHFANDKQGAVILSITGGKLTINASSDKGAFIGELALKDAPDLSEVAVNAGFLLETLAHFSGDVVMVVKTAKAPLVWEDPATGREHGLCLLMPIKLAPVAAAQEVEE
jgi:DNA polymerase III sliding clamp (beta) subunit (PCNA family)